MNFFFQLIPVTAMLKACGYLYDQGCLQGNGNLAKCDEVNWKVEPGKHLVRWIRDRRYYEQGFRLLQKKNAAEYTTIWAFALEETPLILEFLSPKPDSANEVCVCAEFERLEVFDTQITNVFKMTDLAPSECQKSPALKLVDDGKGPAKTPDGDGSKPGDGSNPADASNPESSGGIPPIAKTLGGLVIGLILLAGALLLCKSGTASGASLSQPQKATRKRPTTGKRTRPS